MIIPVEITELNMYVKEAAVKGKEALRRRADIPSRPSALFVDKLATILDTSSTID